MFVQQQYVLLLSSLKIRNYEKYQTLKRIYVKIQVSGEMFTYMFMYYDLLSKRTVIDTVVHISSIITYKICAHHLFLQIFLVWFPIIVQSLQKFYALVSLSSLSILKSRIRLQTYYTISTNVYMKTFLALIFSYMLTAIFTIIYT